MVVAISIAAGAGVASASRGGGGVGTPGSPRLSDVVCLQRCAGLRVAAPGSRVQLSGRNLDGVTKVEFAGGAGHVSAAADSVTPTSAEATVPAAAKTGRLKALAYGVAARTPRRKRLEIVPPARIPDSGDFQLSSAEAHPHRTYYDGLRPPGVQYLFAGAAVTDVRIEVVDLTTETVVSTLVDPAAAPNALNDFTWDGLLQDGRPAPDGDYAFRIGSAAAGTATATSDSDFTYHQFRFPINARHSYGDGYGAGRGHQGQDVFARCGTKLRAVRGGRVQMNKVQSAAGNYLVIDGKRTKKDYMYAHLLTPSPLEQGARVHTGQAIGQVGQTGNASGCHLHFEVWSSPGWYEGGHALPSVRRLLDTWDAWS
ncbi:MAG: peptidoglycan DD-metalloendopeptidase family protein [Solirubrobacterales bacterium]|nr:peptidoglycan DD-metalloendopeptidase family protein [Solirubrobacterales bacterium]